MAFKYRQVNPQTGDIVDVNDLNVNNREFVNEMNGFLDRDNIPYNAISARRVTRHAFNAIHFDRIIEHQSQNFVTTTTDTVIPKTSKTCVISSNLTSWQNKSDANNNQMLNAISFEADCDGLVICEWTGNFRFGHSRTQTQSAGVNYNIPQVVEFRILINGIEVTKLTRIPDSPSVNAQAMYGAIPVPAGEIRIIVEARTYTVKGSNINAAATNSSKNIADVYVGTRELICNFRKR